MNLKVYKLLSLIPTTDQSLRASKLYCVCLGVCLCVCPDFNAFISKTTSSIQLKICTEAGSQVPLIVLKFDNSHFTQNRYFNGCPLNPSLRLLNFKPLYLRNYWTKSFHFLHSDYKWGP